MCIIYYKQLQPRSGYVSKRNGDNGLRPSASVDNTLRDVLNSSYPTKAEFINC